MTISRTTLLGFLCTAVLSALLIFPYFQFPQQLIWDESFYVADAERYLDGTFFMETHPPLGKLLIAAGEKLLDANPHGASFSSIDRLQDDDITDGTAFTGYRLFPALFTWLSALVLFGIFMILLKKPLFALLLSFLFIFDNALVVQGRAALLEGPQVFFVLLSILLFFLGLRTTKKKALLWIVFGLGVAATCAGLTKINGFIALLLVPALALARKPEWIRMLLTGLFGFLVAFIGIWQIHFSLLSHPDPALENNGYFSLSEENRTLLDGGNLSVLTAFPSIFADIWTHQMSDHENYKPFDACSPHENGSPVWSWPLGGRSIHYRWGTNDQNTFHYVTLQANPAVWWLSSTSLLVGLGMLLLSFRRKKKLLHHTELVTLLSLYAIYMLILGSLDRVLHLQTYLIALTMSFVIVGIVVDNLQMKNEQKTNLLIALGLVLFFSFQFYRPLTYYQPLTTEQIEKRAILPLWNLQCAKCPRSIPEHCAKRSNTIN